MKPIEYDYYIHPLTDGKTVAYKAVIPAFRNAIVFGETMKELEDGIRFCIEDEIETMKKEGKPIPPKKTHSFSSGKFVLRIDPALHERLFLSAKANKKSLNKFIEETLEASLKK